MSTRDEKTNSKEKFIKLKAPLYFSPHPPKKLTNITKLYTETKNIHQETEYNLSKNKIKQKLNGKNLNKNVLNIQLPDTFKKNSKIISGISEEKKPQSHKKNNNKIYLKKNMIQNISNLNYTEENIGEKDEKFMKNRLNNIKFNIGKSSQNFLNNKISTTNLKKNAESAYELLDNNYLRQSKPKTKNVINVNNINQIDFIYTSGNDKKDEPITPPPKIIFLKNQKSKDQLQMNDNNNNDNDEKKEGINCVLRNTFTNVKIYPTTFLNNKIIYQNDNNNINNNQSSNNKSENSNNSSSMRHNNSKIKKEKIIIDIADKKSRKNNEKIKFQSIEELHYFYVDTLQKGKAFSIKLDK
jgi:hypothetical protein